MIGENGIIQDLTFENAFVGGEQYAGTIAGINKGRIENCRFINIESSSLGKAGGIAGSNLGGEIINCSISGSGTISGIQSGGVVGSSADGKIEKCNSSITVFGKDSAGGIVGANFNCEVINCISKGTVKADCSGGIVGRNHGGQIYRCYSASALSENSLIAGGIVGLNQGLVSNCVAANECINGSRYINFNSNWKTGPFIIFGHNSQIGRIAGGSDYDKLPKNCNAWDGIKTNKMWFNGENGEKVSTEDLKSYLKYGLPLQL